MEMCFPVPWKCAFQYHGNVLTKSWYDKIDSVFRLQFLFSDHLFSCFSRCVRTQIVDLCQEDVQLAIKVCFIVAWVEKASYLCKYKKVNRLFRLVVINLGF